jgi:hypothetical protein
MNYEVITNEPNPSVIKRTNDDGTETWIPMVESNADYQAYLKRDEPQVEHLTEIPTQEAQSL